MASLPAPLRSRWIAAIAVFMALALLCAGVASAKDIGWWDSTEFQVVNLDPVPARFTARFVDGLTGATVFFFTDQLPPFGTRFYQPEEMQPGLPPLFEGVLAIESEQNVAATILHRDEQGDQLPGATAFEVIDEAQLTTDVQFPIDGCTIVVVHNPWPEPANAELAIYDDQGTLLLFEPRDVVSQTTVSLVLRIFLPSLVDGGAVLTSDLPLKVTVVRSCLGITGVSSYVATSAPSAHWLVPQALPVGGGQDGLSLIGLKNASSSQLVSVTLSSPGGGSVGYDLVPMAGRWVAGPSGPAGPLAVSADGPIIVSVLTQYGVLESQEPPGDYIYGAFSQASNRLALPVLLRDYDGWSTDGGIYIQNAGHQQTVVRLRYVTVDGDEFFDQAPLQPGAVWSPAPASLAYQHAAAMAWADQPIVALVTAKKLGVLDGWFSYRGINYTGITPERQRYYLPLVVKGG